MQKTDAMISYERSTDELMRKIKGKHTKDDVMHIETRNLVVAAAALLVIVLAASLMSGVY
ncbi:MAG TPA: hypothetical protein VN455_02110 [Methanotrichaceae archaeon]|nr:hypothetical protein [Methanotrichaceae archaeon]